MSINHDKKCPIFVKPNSNESYANIVIILTLNLHSLLCRNEVYCSVQIDKNDKTEKNIKPKDKNDNPVSNFFGIK